MSRTPEIVRAAYRARLNPDDPEAQLILADLARQARMYQAQSPANDPILTAHLNGRREMATYILHMCGWRMFPGLTQPTNEERQDDEPQL